jgi:hypothetical protein
MKFLIKYFDDKSEFGIRKKYSKENVCFRRKLLLCWSQIPLPYFHYTSIFSVPFIFQEFYYYIWALTGFLYPFQIYILLYIFYTSTQPFIIWFKYYSALEKEFFLFYLYLIYGKATKEENINFPRFFFLMFFATRFDLHPAGKLDFFSTRLEIGSTSSLLLCFFVKVI